MVVAKSYSSLTRCRFPEFALFRGAEFVAGPFAAVAGKTIKMARRTALRNGIFPTGFEPTGLIEAHEDGIERAGGDARLTRDGVAVMPLARASEEGLEDSKGLTREADANAHSVTLHK